MEKFFRAVANCKGLPSRENVINNTYTQKQIKTVHDLFDAHGMDVLGPPLVLE